MFKTERRARRHLGMLLGDLVDSFLSELDSDVGLIAL
jgi:hypothetical protein